MLATTIAFATGDNLEGTAILIVIVINAGIGFFTEWKAATALSALQKQGVRVARVIREGNECEIPAADLVPGDLVILASGVRVPADGRIVESIRLQIEEAALTGESNAVSRSVDALEVKELPIGDRANMAYLSTTITEGRGELLVTALGGQTEVGKIGLLIDEAIRRASPLEKKLSRLGRLLVLVTIALCLLIILFGWLCWGYRLLAYA